MKPEIISLVTSVCPSVRPSVRVKQLGYHLTEFYEILYLSFLENPSRKFKFHWNQTKITGTLHENVFTFMTISRRILLRMRNVLDKICTENQNTNFTFNNNFSKNRAVYERLSKNMVKPKRPQKAINIAHARFKLDKQGYTRARTCTRAWAHTHARTRAYTQKNM